MTEVDDPYVVERVYAVAYGVCLRSRDAESVGRVADLVYQRFFASEAPEPHILTRDYARGVIERALHLNSKIEVNWNFVRPPYKSTWPRIPTEQELTPFTRKGATEERRKEFGPARNRIEFSVMIDDFARYVIGTNRSDFACNWLSLTLDEPSWEEPLSPEKLLDALLGEVSAETRAAWTRFEELVEAADEHALEARPEYTQLCTERDEALSLFRGCLTDEQALRFDKIWPLFGDREQRKRAPRFDLRQVQRYVLKRVFDLGWTEDRFAHFDAIYVSSHGRDESKAERIGKKYQWIAYHEILAYISDRFQYREEFGEDEGDKVYEGPWQLFLRDIDPSTTLRSVPGGTPWDGHALAWWAPSKYDAWDSDLEAKDWTEKSENLPNPQELLVVTRPEDGTRWITLYGHYRWKQKSPADRESTEVERRELWNSCWGYLLRTGEAEAFLDWAQSVDFWGSWMPEAQTIHKMFLGEHAWAPAAQYFQKEFHGDRGWTTPENGCPVPIRITYVDYLREKGFDCAIDESFSLRLPVPDLLTGLKVHWAGRGADYVNEAGEVIIQDPTAHSDGPSTLLVREDALQEFLVRNNLTLGWSTLGEKRVLSPSMHSGKNHGALRMTGAYLYDAGKTRGSIKYLIDAPWEE